MQPAAALLVEGAGTSRVNGTYTLLQQSFRGGEVFRKPGSTLIIQRSGQDGWGIVDSRSRGGDALKWSPLSNDLYRVSRISGPNPPELGWEAVEGSGPTPIVREWANGERVRQLRSGISWPSRSRSEPRLRPIRGPGLGGSAGEAHREARASSRPTVSLPSFLAAAAASGRHEHFLFAFSVVLARPCALLPWGVKWAAKPYNDTGARIVASLQAGTPQERWNTWQGIRGRPELRVRPGDQLLKVDGRWAFTEAPLDSGGSASDGTGGPLGDGQHHSVVMDFARWARRPSRPSPPRVEPWGGRMGLRVSWNGREGWSPSPLAWALCLEDVEHGKWFAVDGESALVQPVILGSIVSALPLWETSIVLYRGLQSGKTYKASVAVLTTYGWSAFSDRSEAVGLAPTLRAGRRGAELVALAAAARGPDGDAGGAAAAALVTQFIPPSEMVPGASAPVAVEPGRRSLPTEAGRLCLRLALGGASAGGVELRVLGPRSLLVESVGRDQADGGWAAAPPSRASETLDLHGERVVPDLQPGDAIVRVNGLTSAEEMREELARRPPVAAVVLLRHLGGAKARLGSPAATAGGVAAAFHVEGQLDGELVALAEDVKRHALLPAADAKVALRLVERDVDKLWEAIHALPLTFDPVRGISKPELAQAVEPALVDDAIRRAQAMNNIAKTEGGLAKLYAETDSPEEDNFYATKTLRASLADPSCDPDAVKGALEEFLRVCAFSGSSPVAQALIDQAGLLCSLWTRRRRSEELRAELRRAMRLVLGLEAERRAALAWPVPPKELRGVEDPSVTALGHLVAEAAPLAGALGFDAVEAAAVLERHRWAARQKPRPSDACRRDAMDGGIRCLTLGDRLGWWN